ncbi:MAG: hypothetical protein NTW11_02380 [Candidatus Staskawiczbacteria bacterium]|nr:hypothetical protein [Candidatus Staskawiczbacteria bacterium]
MSAKKILFSTLFILALAFGVSSQVKADYVPKIYAQNLSVSNVSNGQIKGQFTIWNSENYYFPELVYTMRLFKGTDFNTMQLVDTQVSGILSVPPKGTVAESFTYQYPKNIASGNYTFRVQVVTAQGTELGWSDKAVSLTGQNNFLNILGDFSRVLSDGQKYYPLEGVNISPKSTAIGYLKIQNLGAATTVIPQIKIFKRQYNMSLVKQYNDSLITFSKGETKEINLTFPQYDTPESYLAEVKFYNNNQQVSGIQYFRWVVQGAGGKILYIRTDKDSYMAGENMTITIDSVGPPDFSTIKGAGLDVTVYNQDKNVVYTVSKNIELTASLLSTTISVPVKADLFHPIISAQITDKGKVLDQQKTTLPVVSTQAKQLQKNSQITTFLIYLLIIAIISTVITFCVKSNKFKAFLKRKKLIK